MIITITSVIITIVAFVLVLTISAKVAKIHKQRKWKSETVLTDTSHTQ